MAINKVQFGSNTLMDITDTTTETEDVIEGKVFYAKDGVRSVGSLGDATQAAHGLMSATDKAKLDRISTMIGATSSEDGTSGLVPAPTTSDVDKFLAGDGTYKDGGQPMVILSYGSSTWNDFINAYNNRVIVYCRASSNSNPATGAQGRMAFMAYVNNGDNPTEVEFQYYRSVSSHSTTQMGDQVFIYKLNKTNGWSVTTREASIKQISAGSNGNLSVAWSSNKVTIDGGLPAVTSSDNDKMLKVVNGVWTITNPIAFSDISGTVGLDQGGTNATSAAGARTNLDVYSTLETDNAITQSMANIGSIYYESSGEQSVAFANKTKAICSLTLPAGTYVITGQCCFYGCTASTRQGITFSLDDDTDGKFDTMAYTLQTKSETTTSNQWYNITRIAQPTSTIVVYLMGFDTTVTRTILSNIRAVRIK